MLENFAIKLDVVKKKSVHFVAIYRSN